MSQFPRPVAVGKLGRPPSMDQKKNPSGNKKAKRHEKTPIQSHGQQGGTDFQRFQRFISGAFRRDNCLSRTPMLTRAPLVNMQGSTCSMSGVSTPQRGSKWCVTCIFLRVTFARAVRTLWPFMELIRGRSLNDRHLYRLPQSRAAARAGRHEHFAYGGPRALGAKTLGPRSAEAMFMCAVRPTPSLHAQSDIVFLVVPYSDSAFHGERRCVCREVFVEFLGAERRSSRFQRSRSPFQSHLALKLRSPPSPRVGSLLNRRDVILKDIFGVLTGLSTIFFLVVVLSCVATTGVCTSSGACGLPKLPPCTALSEAPPCALSMSRCSRTALALAAPTVAPVHPIVGLTTQPSLCPGLARPPHCSDLEEHGCLHDQGTHPRNGRETLPHQQ